MNRYRPARRDVAGALALAAGGLLVFVGAFAAGYVAVHRGAIVPGVSVSGVELGGLSRATAEAKLRAELPDPRSGQLTLTLGARRFAIAYADIGRDYDFGGMLDDALTVARAGAVSDQVVTHLQSIVDHVDLPSRITWDKGQIDTRVRALVASVSKQPRDATLEDGNDGFAVVPSELGMSADADAAVAAVDAVLAGTGSGDAAVSLTLKTALPTISTEVAQAAADRLNRISALPLHVATPASAADISSEQLNAWLTAAQAGPGVWIPVLDERAITEFVDGLAARTDVPVRDGTYRFVDSKPVVVPAQDGQALDVASAVIEIRQSLLLRADGASTDLVTLPTKLVAPSVSTAHAQTLVGEVTRLSSWTTKYEPSSMNGFGVNIRRPTELIDGTVVEPGAQFDFVAVAGPITVANGYSDGAAIINGNTKLDGVVGGGLCSASTTLFNAALRAGFQIDARRAHAYYISRYPVGLDATIWVSGANVQTVAFTNDSPYPILIRGINRRGSVTYEIYGVSDGRDVSFSDPVVSNERKAWTELEYTDDLAPGETKRVEYAFDGFDSVVTRRVTTVDGETLHNDTFRSSYRRVTGVILVGRALDDPPAGTRVRADGAN